MSTQDVSCLLCMQMILSPPSSPSSLWSLPTRVQKSEILSVVRRKQHECGANMITGANCGCPSKVKSRPRTQGLARFGQPAGVDVRSGNLGRQDTGNDIWRAATRLNGEHHQHQHTLIGDQHQVWYGNGNTRKVRSI